MDEKWGANVYQRLRETLAWQEGGVAGSPKVVAFVMSAVREVKCGNPSGGITSASTQLSIKQQGVAVAVAVGVGEGVGVGVADGVGLGVGDAPPSGEGP